MESYKSELDFLIQEKDAILDELNQINVDINEVTKTASFSSGTVRRVWPFSLEKKLETTIRQTNDEKRRAFESAQRLKTEYNPLKENITNLRESIGLDSLEDGQNDDIINGFM